MMDDGRVGWSEGVIVTVKLKMKMSDEKSEHERQTLHKVGDHMMLIVHSFNHASL